jgi:hypothetical protein
MVNAPAKLYLNEDPASNTANNGSAGNSKKRGRKPAADKVGSSRQSQSGAQSKSALPIVADQQQELVNAPKPATTAPPATHQDAVTRYVSEQHQAERMCCLCLSTAGSQQLKEADMNDQFLFDCYHCEDRAGQAFGSICGVCIAGLVRLMLDYDV